MLTGKKALITGATGFIGGRLVEKLILYHGAQVRALVRDFAHASRIARYNLETIGGRAVDAEAFDRAVAGGDAILHCAHDWQGDQRNLDSARMLAEACLRHKVRRLIHVSYISAYEPLPDGEVDESTPAEPCGWSYPDNKLAVERLLLEYGDEHGLPVVVLQPTIVYGPFARSWTVAPVMRLRAGRLALPDNGGLCNAVYVDDVVDALILAAQRDEAVGERFLISGPDTVTWREFYAAYERMLGTKSVVLMPAEEIGRINQRDNGVTSNIKMLRQDPIQVLNWAPVRKLYKFARRRVGERLRKKARQTIPPPLHVPDETRLALLRAHTTVKIDKARRLLGYEPAFNFERGMDLTAQFVKWANL